MRVFFRKTDVGAGRHFRGTGQACAYFPGKGVSPMAGISTALPRHAGHKTRNVRGPSLSRQVNHARA
jgi:hypothetical protein